MSELEHRIIVENFIDRWKDRGEEKQETQRFWIDLLSNVLGISNVTENVLFEQKTVGGGISMYCVLKPASLLNKKVLMLT